MKRGKLFSHVPGYYFALSASFIPISSFANMAADCEAQAEAAFQKKSVAMEFSLINGELSEIEASDVRDQLKAHLGEKKQVCQVSASRASASKEKGVAF